MQIDRGNLRCIWAVESVGSQLSLGQSSVPCPKPPIEAAMLGKKTGENFKVLFA